MEELRAGRIAATELYHDAILSARRYRPGRCFYQAAIDGWWQCDPSSDQPRLRWNIHGCYPEQWNVCKNLRTLFEDAHKAEANPDGDVRVASWKGIPYAQPPVGQLRFMPTQALAAQNSSVVDVTTNALRCVQFAGAPYGVINSNIVGPRSGPGQEDCLKLWIWKPANVTAGARLPVMFYIHVGCSVMSRVQCAELT